VEIVVVMVLVLVLVLILVRVYVVVEVETSQRPGCTLFSYLNSFPLYLRHVGEPEGESILTMNEHGNDLLFYSAVEPDSLIAILRHFLAFFFLTACNGKIILIVPG